MHCQLKTLQKYIQHIIQRLSPLLTLDANEFQWF